MSLLTNSGECFIRGDWVNGSGTPFTAEDPATGNQIWQGNGANEDDIDDATEAARDAFPAWARLPLDLRIAALKRYQAVLEGNRQDLARAIHLDSGKPLWEADTEAAAMIGKIDISIRAQEERTGTKNNDIAGARAVLRHRPHGVVAVFGPYNFPGHLANGHIVPALLAGNTVILKPSELTPLTGEFMARAFDAANLPTGVFNLVQGEKETGIALSRHSGIDGLFFTGSAQTGLALHHQFAGQPQKILALELGGNNPLVAWDIQDRDAAARMILHSAFISAGQRCTCARRLIVPDNAKGDDIMAKLAALIDRVEVLPGNSPFMGPVITNQAAMHLLDSQRFLIASGGKPIREMRRPLVDRPFLTPGLIDVTDIDNRADEELFGPLLQVIRVATFDDALQEANDTKFGLAAGLLSDDDMLWQRFVTDARAGIVNWNKPLPGASSAAPFGGIGMSGNHRPAAFYAADYCAWPMASLEADSITMQDNDIRGLRPAGQE